MLLPFDLVCGPGTRAEQASAVTYPADFASVSVRFTSAADAPAGPCTRNTVPAAGRSPLRVSSNRDAGSEVKPQPPGDEAGENQPCTSTTFCAVALV